MAQGADTKTQWDPKAYWTTERKAEHAAKMRKVFEDPEQRAKLQGRVVSQEEKDQIRDSLKKHYETAQGPMTGKTHSELTKLRLKAKMLTMYGKPVPEAVTKRIAELEG